MFLRRFLRWRARNVAISNYVRRLPDLLAADYGKADKYTPAQVRRTIERNRLNPDYSCYGIAMFCSESDFNAHHQATGEACSFADMRVEISQLFFQGNADFSTADMAGVFSGPDGGGHGHDGGYSGGDSGGGGHH